MPSKKLALALGGLALLAILVAGGVLVWFGFFRTDFRPMPFDAAVWRFSPAEFSHASVRLRMADDLLEHTGLTGRSRQEIVALLGEPDDTGYFRDYDMVYLLGQERSWIAIDGEWLVLKLDEQNRVQEARLMKD